MTASYNDFIKNHGTYLEEKLGVKEWAFNRHDALILLGIMKNDQIPCMGGDVIVEEEDGRLSYANANWYYNRSESETFENYVEHSTSKAQEYINNFLETKGKKYYYVLV
jgi:hypothetical protein